MKLVKLVPIHLGTKKRIHNATILTHYDIPTTRKNSKINIIIIRDILLKLIALVVCGRVVQSYADKIN